jgi:hypothetical protein
MRSLCLVALVSVLFHANAARAGDLVVIESYAGTRPAGATRTLQTLLDELTRRDFLAGTDVVGRRFESRVSRPALTALGLPADFATQLDAGHKAWIAGSFTDAIKLLQPMVSMAHANPGAFAKNQGLLEKLEKGLIALALSQYRIGDKGAMRQTFGEVVRSFETTLQRSTYGAEAAELFEQVKAEVSSAGKGTLIVKERSGGGIYVNEKFIDIGSARVQLYPGEYRVFAKVQGNQLSRAHRVVVTAAEETKLTIDTGFDQAVHTSPEWTGLVFASTAEREKLEATYAAAFANAIDARSVAVIGIDQAGGKPVIFGALVNLFNGTDNRRAAVALDPAPADEMLRGLARFLNGDPAPPGLQVQIAGNVSEARATDADVRPDLLAQGSPRSRVWPGWKWVTAGGAAAGIAAGVIVYSYNGGCSVPNMDPCASTYETATYAWASFGVAAALAGVSVYLFLRSDGEEPRRTAFVAPATGGAIAGYRASF